MVAVVQRAPVETWTVLFTDQVGSTAMRVQVGEEALTGSGPISTPGWRQRSRRTVSW